MTRRAAKFDLDAMTPEVREMVLGRFREAIEEQVPHNRALGLQFVGVSGQRVAVRLPYDPKLIGNPMTGVIHGGAITSLMDATCGTAVFIKLMLPIPVATLDFRIDYLKPAKPGVAVIASAECIKLTERVAFVRCESHHEGDEHDVIAVANGTFMVFRDKRRPKRGAAS
jgi:uncharacterized protein (TIGR00369 family)